VNDINARITAIIQRYIQFVVRVWALEPTSRRGQAVQHHPALMADAK
jgi:hypothetical protein